MAYANFASTFRRRISMPIVSLDGLSFYGLAWILKLLSCKHTQTSIRYARPFTSKF